MAGTLQSRTKSRARRLGLTPKSGSYTRTQARSIRKRLAARRNGSGGTSAPTGGTPGSSGGAGTVAPGPSSGGGASPRPTATADTSLKGRQSVGRSAVNNVASGAGSSRKGKRYSVGYDSAAGKFYHEYGKGSRKYLSNSVASGYGYKRSR